MQLRTNFNSQILQVIGEQLSSNYAHILKRHLFQFLRNYRAGVALSTRIKKHNTG